MDYEAILKDLVRAASIDSSDATAHYYLSFIYAACPDKSFRDGNKGLQHATKACNLTSNKHWEYLTMLAASHAENDNFDKAVSVCEAALKLAPEANKAQVQVMLGHF